MDRIDEVVKVLNANLLYVGNITDYNAFGIAEKVKKGEQVLLYEKTALGSQNGISIDDSKRVTIFHTLKNLKNKSDNERGSGGNPKIVETYDLSLFTYYSNPTNTITSKELLEIAKMAFPSTLSKGNKEALQVSKITFEVTDSSFDKHSIFENVFTKQKNNLSDNSILVQIDYQVTMEFNRNCIPYLPCNLSQYDIELQRGINNCADVKDCIGISSDGNDSKFLNEQGEWVVLQASGGPFLQEGDNITITGYGTEIDPYIISSTSSSNTIYVDRCATTNQVLSGEPSSGIDEAGSTLPAGTTILLRYQTDKRENGVWTIAVGAWSRISGYDTYATLKGLSIIVRNGDTLAGTEWKVVTDTFTVGVDEITINELTNVTAGGGGGGGGSTDLGIANRTSSSLDVTSSSGNDATVPAATESVAGLLNATDKAKLNKIDPNVLKTPVKYAESFTKGQACYVSGGSGTNVLISKADNTYEATSSKTLGLVEAAGATNTLSNVITDGILSGLDTSTATIGDPIWLGTSGNLIYGLANKPVAPAHLVYVGVVTRVSATVGEIFVKVQNGFELGEIHNVLLTSLVDKNILMYEASTQLWKNKTVADALGFAPEDAANKTNTVSGNESSTILYASVKGFVDWVKAGFTLIGALNFAPSVSLASSSSPALGAANSNNVTITGTTTITSFDSVAEGVIRRVKFSGILTLTYNATTLILPTSANITTAAGDNAVFRSLGSGNWECVSYHRRDGTALAGSSSLTVVSDAEMQAGTENTKYVTSLRANTWWTYLKTQAQTISGVFTWANYQVFSGTQSLPASVDYFRRSAANILEWGINGAARFIISNTSVTFGAYTSTEERLATLNTTGQLANTYPLGSYVLQRQSTDQSVTTTSKTSIIKADNSSTKSILLVDLVAGAIFKQRIAGIATTLATAGNVTITIEIDSTVIFTKTLDINALGLNSLTNTAFRFDADIIIETAGATGVVRVIPLQGRINTTNVITETDYTRTIGVNLSAGVVLDVFITQTQANTFTSRISYREGE